MTYPHGPREGAPRTVRIEDQPLPDHEAAFYTPRSGDWLLLAVLVVALLGIGVRVWAQLGWGDQVGRAVFFGLMLMAIYWSALIYTFKLSLAVRVGPQGLAIVRGPWRVELRWSEITRLMERPQVVGGRRYRWVVALARDGRRIQVREDALLDYERFRRDVYERYRLWRDHGGTWGATGGGPFVARESVIEGARWWAIAGLLIALPGLYLSLLIPPALIAGYVLLALALVCVGMVGAVFLRRRTYALDGRMIEARGPLERIQLGWRDVAKVERTRHPASGAILAVVAAGRLTLRMAARGDAGIRGFAWSPRVPEYLTLRGGGRHARIRLHHLAQPEELLAWVEFYTGLRRAGPSRPLEPSAAQADHAAPRRAAATSGPLQPSAVSDPLQPSATRSRPDLSSHSGPLDPWAGERSGEIEEEQAPAQSDTGQPREPVHASMPEPTFRGAPLGANFREPHGLDLPPESEEPEAGRSDEAWLRETSALFSMSGGAPAPDAPRPEDPITDARTAATPATPPPAPRARQFVPAPGPRRSTLSSIIPPSSPPPGPPSGPPPGPPPFPPARTAAPRPQPSFAPYNPDLPDGSFLEAEETPVAPPPPPTPHVDPRWATPPMPAPQADPRQATPPAPPYADAPINEPRRGDLDGMSGDEREDRGEIEGEEDADMKEPAPWRDASWQPPVLPRFGPPSGQSVDSPPRRDGRQTDH